MKLTLPVHLEEAARAGDKLYYVLQERMTLDSVNIIANGAITAHASNYVIFTVYGNDAATAAFVWSSESGKEGTLADATSKKLTDKGSGKATFDAGTIIYVDLAKGGTGHIVDVNLCLNFSQARKY